MLRFAELTRRRKGMVMRTTSHDTAFMRVEQKMARIVLGLSTRTCVYRTAIKVFYT